MPLDNPDIFAIEDWQIPTLQNGWQQVVNSVAGSSTSPIGFYKDPLSIVRMRGRIRAGTANAAAFTLPVGYRPAFSFSITAGINSGSALLITVGANGQVIPNETSTFWIQLEGIQFRAAD